MKLFENIPKIRRILQTLCDVGLDYLTLGQPAPTLSGGEAQRVKLAAELSRPDTGRTLYLLDEPTTGLHFDDLAKLLDVLNRLVDLGNTVVVIEHNLDVIKTADWVIDMGPEAGDGGGYVVAGGTPEDIVAHAGWPQAPRPDGATARSHTGEVLAATLAEPVRTASASRARLRRRTGRAAGRLDITEVGKDARMPWEADGRRWHTRDRVGRNGQPCRWDGRILAEDGRADRSESDKFSPTNWNTRTIVEIASPTKSDGWFLHAITGEEWLLEAEVPRGQEHLQTRRPDRAAGAEAAQRPARPAGLRQRAAREVQEPARSVAGGAAAGALLRGNRHARRSGSFSDEADRRLSTSSPSRVRQKPEDVMPWKVLGRKWHFARKGFPPGKTPKWDTDVLEELCEMLAETAPDGQFLWNNQQVVHVCVNGHANRGPRSTPSASPPSSWR